LTVKNHEFQEVSALHDDGEKEILGQTGNFSGDDLLNIVLKQPATASRLAWRLANEFFGEDVVDGTALDELARQLYDSNLDIRSTVETILRSELFFSTANVGTRIADPVSFLIGPLRALECWRDSPSTLVLAEWLNRMGQDLFYPPNVGGWTGGRSWLSTRTTIARANCMAALIAGNLHMPARPLQIEQLTARHWEQPDSAEEASFLSRLLFGQVLEPANSDRTAALTRLLTSPQALLH